MTADRYGVQEITAAAANGAKAKFERIQDPAKLRRVALHMATQQNLATCVALLKEIAVHFGYSLAVEDGIPPIPRSFGLRLVAPDNSAVTLISLFSLPWWKAYMSLEMTHGGARGSLATLCPCVYVSLTPAKIAENPVGMF